MSKLPYLQGLRGCAALTVVAHHFLAAFYPAAIFGAEAGGRGHAGLRIWSSPFGFLVSGNSAVALFFVLSGYVLSLPFFGSAAAGTDALLSALFKRPFRLAGLVVATVALAFVLARAGLFDNRAAGSLSGSAWLAGYWNAPPAARSLAHWFFAGLFSFSDRFNPPLWTIACELYGSYLTFVFLLLFRKHPWRGWAYVIVGVAFADSSYVGFVAGMFFADATVNFPGLIRRCRRPWLALPLAILGACAASYPLTLPLLDREASWFGGLPLVFSGDCYTMAGAILLFGAILLAPRAQALFALPPVAYLGRISYGLYAVHFLVLGSFSSFLFTRLAGRWEYGHAVAGTVALSLAAMFGLAHLLTTWVDEPVVRLSGRMAGFWLNRSRNAP